MKLESLLRINKEISCYSLQSRASAHLPGKANIRTMNALFHPPFPELLLLNMMSYDIEHPFIQFGSAVLAVLLPSLLSIPSLPTVGGVRVGRKKP